MKMLKHASVAISIILASLYALGLSFHQGYLRTLGIEETQFQLSVDRIFFQGFFATADLSSSAIFWLIMAASGVVIVANLGILFLEIVNKLELKKYIPAWLFSKDENNPNHPFTEFSLKMFLYVVVLFGIYIGILLILIASDKSGTSHAEKFIENIKDDKATLKKITLNNMETYEGYSIICNTSQCAYFFKGKVSVFKNRDVYLIESRYVTI